MATTSHSILTNLHERLNLLEQRFAELLPSREHKNIESAVSDFSERHLAIRSSLDETPTDVALAKADQETNDLEARFEHWLQDIDHKYAREPQRIRNVSM